MIKKSKDGTFTLYAKDGVRKLGTYTKKSDAMKRASQVKDVMKRKANEASIKQLSLFDPEKKDTKK